MPYRKSMLVHFMNREDCEFRVVYNAWRPSSHPDPQESHLLHEPSMLLVYVDGYCRLEHTLSNEYTLQIFRDVMRLKVKKWQRKKSEKILDEIEHLEDKLDDLMR